MARPACCCGSEEGVVTATQEKGGEGFLEEAAQVFELDLVDWAAFNTETRKNTPVETAA